MRLPCFLSVGRLTESPLQVYNTYMVKMDWIQSSSRPPYVGAYEGRFLFPAACVGAVSCAGARLRLSCRDVFGPPPPGDVLGCCHLYYSTYVRLIQYQLLSSGGGGRRGRYAAVWDSQNQKLGSRKLESSFSTVMPCAAAMHFAARTLTQEASQKANSPTDFFRGVQGASAQRAVRVQESSTAPFDSMWVIFVSLPLSYR